MLRRAPIAALRPFVEELWASDDADIARVGVARRERVLPTGSMHVVIRLDAPLHLYAHDADAIGLCVAHAVVGGARDAYYVRDVSRWSRSVGAVLWPGAAQLVLGAPAGSLAARHTALDDLWGSSVHLLREQLAELPRAAQRLDLFEALLSRRVPRARGIDPRIAVTLAGLHASRPVGELVRDSGDSHRRFVSTFHEAVGLTPKVYGRVVRFRRALAQLVTPSDGVRPLRTAELALAMGYSDQPHFQREFRAMAGLAVGSYRALEVVEPGHVPMFDGVRQ